MKVSEEIDALRSMGFNITNFLVLPRVLGVLLAMPILTIIADIAGVLGGLIAAISILDVTISGYLNQLQIAVGISDILTGIIKSLIFGFGIAAVGCFRGMQVRGGAERVGKFTSASL
jgi:phospholipid/cholesterol/gamma-HCH transport system permease protein